MKTVGITVGDINGIGPEVSLKAVYGRPWPRGVRFVFLGDAVLLQKLAVSLGLPFPEQVPHGEFSASGGPVVWGGTATLRAAPGRVLASASRAACRWIRQAVEGCQSGLFSAMVTAPICKEGLKKAGVQAPGHTEMLAGLTHTKRFAMMLMGGGLRVILVTRHVPLGEVPAGITRPALAEAITLAAQALEWLGVNGGPVGVAGLNPHAGDGGALGDEERRIILPTVRALQRKGVPVKGPVPADVIFHYALKGQYGAVVAMYHDQGLAPLKMLAFEEGVNLTLGLPIIRTSPDHGTAFDIAGRGLANPSSMMAAIDTALFLAGRPNPWRTDKKS